MINYKKETLLENMVMILTAKGFNREMIEFIVKTVDKNYVDKWGKVTRKMMEVNND